MDLQIAFNVVIGVVMLLAGYVLKGIRDDQVLVEKNLSDLIHELPNTYARRDDMKEVRDALIRIEQRLIDGKTYSLK